MAERDLSSITAVLALYDLSPTTQTRFPAYAHLNRTFAYGEMFGLCEAALAEVGKPLTMREIAHAVIRAKRWDKYNMMLRRAVAYRPIQSLTKAAIQGRINDIGNDKEVGACYLPPTPKGVFNQ